MTRENREYRRQPGRQEGLRQSSQSRQRRADTPVLRSPALESAERQLGMAGRLASRRAGRTVRYAAEERLGSRAVEEPRKRLPSLRSIAQDEEAQARYRLHSGLTAGWRARARQEKEREQSAGPEPAGSKMGITKEEEERLADLELQLPREAGKIDSWLLIIVLALLCIGIVMVYSASAFQAALYQGDAAYYFQRELIWTILGIVAMLLTMRIDYRVWRRFSLAGMIVVLPLLVIVLKFGASVYGASRWIVLGSFFSLQPSELTKLVLALYIADWLARKGKQVGTFLYGLLPFVLLVGFILALILQENDLGTAIIIAGFATAMFFTAGANILQFVLAMLAGSAVFLLEAFKGYRYYRLMGFLNPFHDITGINLQLYQALLAFGSGGWFGLGLGASRQKTGYLPFPFSDSIFPIIGEELGFVVCALIVLLYLFLAFRGFRLARRTRDLYGALLATGITTWLVLQAMINIGANTGTIPYTGVPLPFISFGGSSLIVSLAGVGILLNISRYIQEPVKPALSRQAIALRRKRISAGYVTASQEA
ncbi:MAG TPA: putative lipid II flippase FtsW [Ktedonobacteraceae bacterium]|nr:putative lipid II flippase FtsW [Ktedonobacteraceae bacterium]